MKSNHLVIVENASIFKLKSLSVTIGNISYFLTLGVAILTSEFLTHKVVFFGKIEILCKYKELEIFM